LPGVVPLHWGPKAIANDDFVNAQVLAAAGSFSPLLGSNEGGTKEPGEPNHGGSPGGASVWYRWTALSNGSASFVYRACSSCTLSAATAVVGIYRGTGVGGLTEVAASGDSNHTFETARGTTYYIAVDSRSGVGGTYEYGLIRSEHLSAQR